MKIGAEDPKKVGALIALMGAAGVMFYVNSGSDAPEPSVSSPAPAAVTAPAIPAARPAATKSGRNISRRIAGDAFKPRIGVTPEEGADLARIDPTLRFDLLAKVQKTEREGGVRNLFQFAAAPPPPPDPVKKGPGGVIIKPGAPGSPGNPVTAAAPTGPPKPPPPPPIPLKFYGFSEPRSAGAKRAFFLEGEDIYVGGEGELINKRYKVIRISPGSVVMEDTQFKHQQTLVIQQEVG